MFKRRGFSSGLLAVVLASALFALATDMPPSPAEAFAKAAVETMPVSAVPVRDFRFGSKERHFGSLTFIGGLELTSPNPRFGSFSAFRFLTPGKSFVGVADTGYWFFGAVEHDEDGRPIGFSHFTMQPMVDRNGEVIGKKWLTDAESLAVHDGIATIGFEREHRISEYRLDPQDMRGPIRNLDFLVPRKELRTNKGFETIAYAPPGGPLKGARVAITERSLDSSGNQYAAILEGPEKGVFTVARKGDFDITDGAFLPNGDLLLLERSFSFMKGVAMELRRIEADTIRPGRIADGPVLLRANMAYQIDNMEGLDVWRRGDGALIASLVSDDNQSILQRNLYLEFRLDE
jgi:hypothetical protein